MREEVAGFVSGAEVRGRQWWRVREPQVGGEGESEECGGFGFGPPHVKCTHVLVGR